MSELSPFVYWAQTEDVISLKVDLKNVQSPDVRLNEDELEFTGIGLGAKGRNEYHFVIEFYLAVDQEKSHIRVMDREVDFSITKKVSQWWPRLTAEQMKPAWLKVDFDKFTSEEDEVPIEEREKDIKETMKSLFDPVKEEELRDEAYQKVYMFMYNLFMFCGFAVVATMLLIFSVKDGAVGIQKAYDNVGGLFVFFQLFQLFEIPFALIGWTATKSVTFPILQIGGRLVNFGLIAAEPRIQNNPVVCYLLMVWCLAELSRYPYYMLKIVDFDVYILKWIRYSIWIILYPAGVLFEAYLVFWNIPHFQETKKFSYHLPNNFNWSFDPPTIMRFYLMFIIFPTFFLLVSHMYRQRVKQLGSILKKTKKD